MAVLIVLMALIVAGTAGPVRRTVDQRQQGELNIHAELDNIVLVIIPSSRLNLLELATNTKLTGDKNSLLQFLKPPKEYEVVNDISPSDELPEISSQQVVLTQHGVKNENEEEVVATVEEMSSTPKEDSPKPTEVAVKEESTVGETVQESVLKISAPEEKKDVKLEEDKSKETLKPSEDKSKDTVKNSEDKPKKVPTEKVEPKKETIEEDSKKDKPKEKITEAEKESDKPRLFTEPDVKTLKELIRPVAAKEESPEGVRRERVIKYKPETKWAPGLVDLLRPVAKGREERQRYAALCAPGVWDSELQTCLMPGETRSRAELARFLQAMRFGIALPPK